VGPCFQDVVERPLEKVWDLLDDWFMENGRRHLGRDSVFRKARNII
jgi:hypothetical protein